MNNNRILFKVLSAATMKMVMVRRLISSQLNSTQLISSHPKYKTSRSSCGVSREIRKRRSRRHDNNKSFVKAFWVAVGNFYRERLFDALFCCLVVFYYCGVAPSTTTRRLSVCVCLDMFCNPNGGKVNPSMKSITPSSLPTSTSTARTSPAIIIPLMYRVRCCFYLWTTRRVINCFASDSDALSVWLVEIMMFSPSSDAIVDFQVKLISNWMGKQSNVCGCVFVHLLLECIFISL